MRGWLTTAVAQTHSFRKLSSSQSGLVQTTGSEGVRISFLLCPFFPWGLFMLPSPPPAVPWYQKKKLFVDIHTPFLYKPCSYTPIVSPGRFCLLSPCLGFFLSTLGTTVQFAIDRLIEENGSMWWHPAVKKHHVSS